MFKLSSMAGALALAFSLPHAARASDAATLAPAQSAPPATAPSSAPGAPATAPATKSLPAISVTSTVDRLDAARSSLSPEVGATIYRFGQRDIANLPLGNATPLNQVLLRAPGVVQDSSAAGQLHVRGDHANLQYRINGVIVPESVSGFGQVLDTRFAESISLITGALPAQYGYRTAGIVDIRSKSGQVGNRGSVDVTVGSRGQREVSGNVSGSVGPVSYFLTGTFLQNNLGIENTTAAANAIHDMTRQQRGFAYVSYVLNSDSRVSLMLGNSNSRFQIPNIAGQTPSFDLGAVPTPDSAALNANQAERNNFQVLSYQSKLSPAVDFQVSLFRRSSNVHYMPDNAGDLAYTGVASNTYRSNVATGVQFDLGNRLNDSHTLRTGLFVQRERGRADNTSLVFAADADGNQAGTTPLSITDNGRVGGHTVGVYVQDEWQATDQFTVNVGARYDQVRTIVDENQLSPRLGAVYQLTPTTRVHAGYARYFTPPPTEKIDTTSVQAFLGTTNALPSDANTAVKSERSDYYDIGISHQLTPRLTVGADAYYKAVRHLQDEGQFGSAYIYSAFNFERAKVYGLELSASYEDRGFTAYGNLALSAAKGRGVETGQFNFGADELAYIASNWVHLDHDATVAASAGAAYRFDRSTVVSSDLLYGSGLRNGFANTTHLPSHFTMNAAVAHTFNVGSPSELTARFSVLNLLDRSWQMRDGTGIGVGAPQYAPRRAFYVTVSKPFTF